MTTELYWLTLSVLLTALLWIPYILNRLVEQGVLTALWDPEGETATRVGWARRLMAAHENAVENLVIFAALVLIAHVAGVSTELTQLATVLYFFSRLAHVVLFTLKTPVLRILAFFGGFIAQMIMVVALLGSAA